MRLPTIALPRSAELRQGLRAALAAGAAYLVTHALGLPQSQWAVISAILVVQASVGASVGAATDRVIGTVLGALVGAAGGLAADAAGSDRAVALIAVTGVMGVVAARWPNLRLGAVTAAIVLLGSVTNPVEAAAERTLEIVVGVLAGLAVATAILPARAAVALRSQSARTLADCAALLDLAVGVLLGAPADPARLQAVNTAIRTGLRAADTRVDEARREQLGMFGDRGDTAPIVRGQRRLWHSILIVVRAADAPLPEPVRAEVAEPLTAMAAAVKARAAALAAALGERTRPPPDPQIDAALATLRAAGLGPPGSAAPPDATGRLYVLVFAFEQIVDNLAELAERAAEHAG